MPAKIRLFGRVAASVWKCYLGSAGDCYHDVEGVVEWVFGLDLVFTYSFSTIHNLLCFTVTLDPIVACTNIL